MSVRESVKTGDKTVPNGGLGKFSFHIVISIVIRLVVKLDNTL